LPSAKILRLAFAEDQIGRCKHAACRSRLAGDDCLALVEVLGER
jgi:hypothetical protein